ncbi:hypothetical protein V5279_25125 [Bradyrhizobium sp. 26S5]|uniref:hypothetical protein n=1 Tax=Bradyrhizobium sp. 26S5 TaxID=3139729 RepID=UPI0030D26397
MTEPHVNPTRLHRENLEARKQQRDDEPWFAAEIFMQAFRDDAINKNRLASIRAFLDDLDVHDVQGAMEAATGKMPWSRDRAFRYFCGSCWNKIKQSSTHAGARAAGALA